MPIDLMSYQDVLAEQDENAKFHLLVGNGFSRACRDDIFAYSALFDRADFKSLSPNAKGAFEALKTSDFEFVMKALRDAATLLPLYDNKSGPTAQLMKSDADGLREVLVAAIAGSHPERPSDIPASSYAACRRFLAPFSKVYSLNYDLLLYWAYMKDEIEPPLSHDDGFRKGGTLDDYVVWEPEQANGQSIYYLHGALHIFDTGTEIQKYTWKNTGVRLIEQIRQALSDNKFPLFVAEGSTNQKKTRIRHSDFLSKGTKSMRALSGSMVILGHSLAANDAHILNNIVRSRINRLYVGVFGSPSTAANQTFLQNARDIATKRAEKKPMEVRFFDASTAHVWG